MKKMITIIALVMLMALVISTVGAFANRADAKPTEPSNKPTEPNEPTGPQKGEVLYTGLVTDFVFTSNGLVLEEGKGYFVNDTYFVAEMSSESFVMPPDGLEFFVDGYSVTVVMSGGQWCLQCEPSCTGTVTFYAAK